MLVFQRGEFINEVGTHPVDEPRHEREVAEESEDDGETKGDQYDGETARFITISMSVDGHLFCSKIKKNGNTQNETPARPP